MSSGGPSHERRHRDVPQRQDRTARPAPPADWVDGGEVSVEMTPPSDGIDLTGDSPEATAAWVEAMAELRTLSAEAPDAGGGA